MPKCLIADKTGQKYCDNDVEEEGDFCLRCEKLIHDAEIENTLEKRNRRVMLYD